MPDDWNSYLCNVNSNPASIFLNLGLREHAPIPDKNLLLWVWVYFKTPRPDGLSDGNEAPLLFEIEDKLTKQMKSRCGAILAGRITTDGHREFYFYGDRSEAFQTCVADTLVAFEGYRFDCGSQMEADWNQYFNVLYPSHEDLQEMKSRQLELGNSNSGMSEEEAVQRRSAEDRRRSGLRFGIASLAWIPLYLLVVAGVARYGLTETLGVTWACGTVLCAIFSMIAARRHSWWWLFSALPGLALLLIALFAGQV